MSDLAKRLRIKAGMIEMGERIAWGSDSALMREAADTLGMAAPDVQEQPLEALASQLLAKRAEILGRPLKWAEAIEITAIVTSMPDEEKQRLLDMDDAPAVQGEPVAWSGWGCQYPGKMPRLYGERRIAELNCDWENGDQVLHFTATSQLTEQKPAPDVTQLVEALETALFGTPLDDVSNRDDDDIWCLCYPHLPERALDALRDHLVRIETALAAYRKGGDES